MIKNKLIAAMFLGLASGLGMSPSKIRPRPAVFKSAPPRPRGPHVQRLTDKDRKRAEIKLADDIKAMDLGKMSLPQIEHMVERISASELRLPRLQLAAEEAMVAISEVYKQMMNGRVYLKEDGSPGDMVGPWVLDAADREHYYEIQ